MKESYEKIQVSVLYIVLTRYGIMCVTLSKDRIYIYKELLNNISQRGKMLEIF